METAQKLAAKHWSVHPWKLTAVVIVVITALDTVLKVLRQAFVIARLNAGVDPNTLLGWLQLPSLLLAAGWAVLTAVVLRSQVQQGLDGRTENRVSWVALPGLVVVLAVGLWDLRYPDSSAAYVWGVAATALGWLMDAALSVLVAALLIPTVRPRSGLSIGALIVAAVTLALTQLQYLLPVALGYEVQLGFWAAYQLPQFAACALVAVALLQAVKLRLWDALALQWGINVVIRAFSDAWAANMGASAPAWMNDISWPILWLLLALTSLYCLRMWDRGISPARPFAAFAAATRR